MPLGHGGGSRVTHLLCWRAGIARDLCSERRACVLVGDRETETVAFPPSTAGVRAGSREGSTAEKSRASSGTPTRTRTYENGVSHSRFRFSEIWFTGVRRNA
jgi:hypothetical protein